MIREREKYIGVKFKTIFCGEFFPTSQEKKLIRQLISAGRKLGFKDKNGGNLSFITKKGMIIKRTGAYLYRLKIKDFVLVTNVFKNKVFVFGKKEPSSETRLHWFIYQIKPEIKVVIHCHDFTVADSKKKLKNIGYIPKLSYGTLELAKAVQNKAKKYNYLIEKEHGVIALGQNINDALNLIKKYHEKFKLSG